MVYTKHGPVHQGRRGQYVGHHWYDDIETIPLERRVMPVTIPHDVIGTHRYGCSCTGCEVYPEELKRRLRKEHARR